MAQGWHSVPAQLHLKGALATAARSDKMHPADEYSLNKTLSSGVYAQLGTANGSAAKLLIGAGKPPAVGAPPGPPNRFA